MFRFFRLFVLAFDVLARLALASGVTWVGVDYRLAPEHVYPAQMEDAMHSIEALREDRGVRRVIVAGDSAGGNLALELQLALRDRGQRQAAGAVLISPWSDLTMPGSSFRETIASTMAPERSSRVRHARSRAASRSKTRASPR